MKKHIWFFFFLLILVPGRIHAQTDESNRLKLVSTVCDATPDFKQIIDTTPFGKSVILALHFENTISFFIGIKKGTCWRILEYESQITSEDSLAFIQLNKRGRKEILIYDRSSFGNSGAFGGSSSLWEELKIIDVDDEAILFEETISAFEERWTFVNDTIPKLDADGTEMVESEAKYFDCKSSVSIENESLIIDMKCNAESKELIIPDEEKEDFCSGCINSGVYQLVNNQFRKIR